MTEYKHIYLYPKMIQMRVQDHKIMWFWTIISYSTALFLSRYLYYFFLNLWWFSISFWGNVVSFNYFSRVVQSFFSSRQDLKLWAGNQIALTLYFIGSRSQEIIIRLSSWKKVGYPSEFERQNIFFSKQPLSEQVDSWELAKGIVCNRQNPKLSGTAHFREAPVIS